MGSFNFSGSSNMLKKAEVYETSFELYVCSGVQRNNAVRK